MALMSKLSRSRAVRWGVLVVVVCAVALVVVALLTRGGSATALIRGGSGGAPSAQKPNPACTPGTPRTSLCPQNKSFDARDYTPHGDAFDCINFANQADAQAVLRADPSDPNHLDDGGGVACRGLPEPRDTRPVSGIAQHYTCSPGETRSALCPQPTRPFDPRYFLRFGNDAYDCSDFASQADAQAVLRFEPVDPNHLDDDGNGIACPDLPGPKDLKPVRRGTP